jgi:hypothetical protein
MRKCAVRFFAEPAMLGLALHCRDGHLAIPDFSYLFTTLEIMEDLHFFV